VTEHYRGDEGLLPSGRLDRSPEADEIRWMAGLPAPPVRQRLPSDSEWWTLYQLIERSVLRYLRALAALPPGAAGQAKLAALRPAALAQLDAVAALCRQGWNARPLGGRQTRRQLHNRRKREQVRRRIENELMTVSAAMEEFGDAAAALVFDHALDALADADGQRRAEAVEDALRGITVALDELTVLSQELLDP